MRLLTSLVAVAGLAEAVIVTPQSPCGSSCGNVHDITSPDDVVCSQEDYAVEGQLFQSCVQCEILSDHEAQGQSDTQWALYNLRYAMSYCLFGVPENENVLSTPCITSEACGPFRLALQYGNLSIDSQPYEYCDLWPVDDTVHLEQCSTCLRSGQEYMSNFFNVLQAGCQQKPPTGATVAIDGEIFSTEPVKITDPSPLASIDPAWFDQGPLDISAKAGIAAGGLVLLLSLVGCVIVWRGKRRRRAFLRNYDPQKYGGRKSWPSPIKTGNMREINTSVGGSSQHHQYNNSNQFHSGTPLSQRPLREQWDESPMTTTSEQQGQAFQRYFSPYSSQYNSPVSASDNINAHNVAMMNAQWPVIGADQQLAPPQVERNIGLALGSHSDGKRPEEFEMQRVEGVAHMSPPPPGESQVTFPQPVSPVSPVERGDDSYFSHGHERSYSGSYRNFTVSRTPSQQGR